MQDYTRLKAQALTAVEKNGVRERDDMAWLLVLEQLIFQTEAEARWLDHCEVPADPALVDRPGGGAGAGLAGGGSGSGGMARRGPGQRGPHATARDVRPARPALSTRPTESTGSTRPTRST